MNINSNWKFYRKGEESNAIFVDLPYDAMFREERNNYLAGDKVSFFDGKDYVYEKELYVPKFDRKTSIYIEIEGAYHDSSLYINGEFVHTRHYGYADFYVDITNYIKLDNKNIIRIETINSDQPNSRWYSGGGIYRDVSIYFAPETHILPRKFGIRTKDYRTGEIEIKSKFSKPTASHLIVKDKDGNVVLERNYEENISFQVTEKIEKPNYWSIKNPYLYNATLSIDGQEETIRFGVRQIELSVENGLLLNGEKTILFGACIHSDNGLLGAETYPDVEKRKVEMLKKAGYNSVRSAHNPIVKSFLDAADELGLLVIDEYTDCWYFHKTKYDYASFVMEEYKQDLLDMVDKDFSHPSVIFYSTGNEVAETAFKKGVDFTKVLTDYLHELDDSRPVTCGINVFFNGIAHTPIAQYSEGKAEKQDAANKKDLKKKPKKAKREGSSDIFNDLAAIFGASFMANGAKIKAVDKNTKDAFANLDIAGYNYGIYRYEKDLKKYPNRFILGTETFCKDAGLFYNLAQKHPRIIGDFVWTALDYIGEAGFSAWINCHDFDYTNEKSGWLLNGGGRIDILGNWLSEMDFTRVSWHLDTIAIGTVSPYELRYKHSQAAWKFSRCYKTWTYEGFEGKKSEVEVYSWAPYFELYQDGKLIKKFKNNKSRNRFKTKLTYRPGVLKAIAYDENHNVLGETTLKTAGTITKLTAIPEKQKYKAGEMAYVHFRITDENEETKHNKDEQLTITSIKGGKLKAFGNATVWNKTGYLTNSIKTYQGCSTAVIQMDGTSDLEITLKSETLGEVTSIIKLI